LVQNYTNSWIIFHSCNDVDILKNWEKMEFSSDFCKEISIWSWKIIELDYASEYKNFDKIWKYSLEARIDDKKFISQFELKNKWFIKKTFTGLIYTPIYNLVVWLIKLFNWSFWWAIIWITLILKLLLLRPQQKMMISQRKMQEIQPKVKEIQEKYKGDQAKLWQELLALYSKEKINPLGSCWFLLIQMPVIIVVYNIIRSIQTPANEYYLYSFFSDFSLTSINFNFYWLDLLASGWLQGMILALFVAGIQFLQVKISLPPKLNSKENKIVLEKKKGEKDYSKLTPDPEMMNKFMLYWMPIMIWFFTYSFFAALWLYWGISTIFTIFQNLVVNKMLKK
jgi:YidC/Oxa1 family membrane protein insertase